MIHYPSLLTDENHECSIKQWKEPVWGKLSLELEFISKPVLAARLCHRSQFETVFIVTLQQISGVCFEVEAEVVN